MDTGEAMAIGARARMIRRRRGSSLVVVAGLVGITKQYLSQLELGQRGFSRRGLIEDLAHALGCSVADLTGQPYLPPDRESARAKTVMTQIERGLGEATLDDVPDLCPRPLDALEGWLTSAVELRDTASYRPSGEGIDAALIELHVHLAITDGCERQRAAELLTQAAYHAFVLATTFGYLHLAHLAAQRALDAAQIAERPELEAFAMFALAPSVARTGGRHRAVRMLERALDDAQPLTAVKNGGTLGAETFGLLHLMRAHFAARDSDSDAAADHLDEAARVATLTGERNGLQQHFGLTNVNVWRVAIGAELGQGPLIAERVEREPIDLDTLGSKDRIAALHFDLARCWAQAEGARDGNAIRHLDMADRIAPTRIRNDPIARDLVLTLDRRARRRVWELDSLCNRFGIRAARVSARLTPNVIEHQSWPGEPSRAAIRDRRAAPGAGRCASAALPGDRAAPVGADRCHDSGAPGARAVLQPAANAARTVPDYPPVLTAWCGEVVPTVAVQFSDRPSGSPVCPACADIADGGGPIAGWPSVELPLIPLAPGGQPVPCTPGTPFRLTIGSGDT